MNKIKHYWIELKIIRHEFIAALMVFCIGIYYGLINTVQIDSYYKEYLTSVNQIENSITDSMSAISYIINDSFVSFIIFCVFLIGCGLLFSVVPIFLMAMQGMYMGFWIKMMSDSHDELSITTWVLVGISELIQIFVLMFAAALGIRFGKIFIRFIWQLIRKKVVTLRFEIQIWWLLVRGYITLMLVLSMVSTIIKIALEYFTQ